MPNSFRFDPYRLAEVARQRGWSEPHLAHEMGLSYPFIWRVLHGKGAEGRGLGSKGFAGLLRAGIDPTEVFTITVEPVVQAISETA